MKIQLLSDLHVEFEHYTYQPTDCDVVVLAGDIHTKAQGVKWAMENITDKPVLYILGNHEFYKKTYPKLFHEARELAAGSNVQILENEVATIDGVNFLGCTLWTDFKLFGDPMIAGYHCQQAMNDYKKIKKLPGYSKIRSLDVARIHEASKKWLATELKARTGQKNVVITHHAPSVRSVPVEYKEDLTTAAYASDLESFISEHKPVAWFHGHMHTNSNYMQGCCRVACNPRGYSAHENPEFSSVMTVDV